LWRQLVAEDPHITWELQQHEPAPYYNRRNIAVMGDAAHACMPFVGQGAAQAIEDAAVLTALFRRLESLSQIEKVLKAYDQVRRPRAQAVVTMGCDFGRLYDFALPGVEDDPVKMKQFMGKAAAFTNNADLEKQNQDALDAFDALL
ncbi:FAD/NAD(P)-binding domain-containing protein, partial [Aureobasidium melanogenum]